MTILEYISKYGNKTFDEMKFNEVDNIIFASLSYIDFNNIVPRGFNKISIKDAGKKYFENYRKDKNKMNAYKSAIEVFKKIRYTKRYRDLLLYNYYYIGNAEQQFSALSIEINSRLVYVSYEGTDNLVSGWEEDFKMAYMFPVKAQRNAINYINRFIFSRKNIIIGGHSKGGNLALVAGMYANHFVKRRIVNIYSNDGPGLRKREFTSDEYKIAAMKLISIIPNYSFVGLLLRHSKKYKVIKSDKKGIMAHDFISWQVDDTTFEKSELSSFSKVLDTSMIEWVKKYDDKQRKAFVDSLFDIFRRCGISDLEEIMKNKKMLLKLALEYREVDKTTKKMIREFLVVLFQYLRTNKDS